MESRLREKSTSDHTAPPESLMQEAQGKAKNARVPVQKVLRILRQQQQRLKPNPGTF